MQHTIKEASKLFDACKRGRTIQRREQKEIHLSPDVQIMDYTEWEDIEDFNEDYILEEEFEYRVNPHCFRLPTVEEFMSVAQEFSKVDRDKEIRIFLDEKSGNKLNFHFCTEDVANPPRSQCWCSDFTDDILYLGRKYVRYFDGLYIITIDDMSVPRGVRLVSDGPFEGGIKFGNVWWKPENEEGLYTWVEAKKKFG